MAVKALYDYEFPSADRAEVYGDDMLVNVMWRGNMLFASPSCFRAPKSMTWADFKAGMIDPWAAADQDYDPSAAVGWQVGDRSETPADGATLAELGVEHRGLITFRTQDAP